ncbi:MAG: ester cyclase [Erysipelotrichaceae bacterium]|nr:ester cyclase [Erysipelotrichaceae bacterium]
MKTIVCKRKNQWELEKKRLSVTFDDGEEICVVFADDGITEYDMRQAEDGIWTVTYAGGQGLTCLLADANKRTVTGSYVTEGKLKVCQGMFMFVNEDGSEDKTPFTNKEKAVDFWLRYFNEHDESAIEQYLSAPYVQHNPHVADGIEAFYNEFHNRFTGDMKNSRTEVKRVAAGNDIVYIHNLLKRSPEVKGHAAVDIFRFENGRIVEHWDVIQTMPEHSENDHPMF